VPQIPLELRVSPRGKGEGAKNGRQEKGKKAKGAELTPPK